MLDAKKLIIDSAQSYHVAHAIKKSVPVSIWKQMEEVRQKRFEIIMNWSPDDVLKYCREWVDL